MNHMIYGECLLNASVHIKHIAGNNNALVRGFEL